MLADLVRLILLILFLPIILIFIGPLLILAVIRGNQPVGPITLDTSRYSPAGRVAAWALGMVLWLTVWGSLIWFAFYAFFPPATITAAPTTVPTPVMPQATSTPTPILPTSTLVQLVELTAAPATTTPVDAAATPTPPTSTPTATPTPRSSWTPTPPPAEAPSTPTRTATPTPTSTPTPTPTPTSQVSPTFTPTLRPATPTVAPSATATAEPTSSGPDEGTLTPTISPQATLTLAEKTAVVEVVKAGNILLQAAIAEANEENLQNLATIWRGLAFQVARNFATQMSEQYAKPMVVEFEYLETPTVDRQSTHREVTVTTREKWAYGGPTEIDREEVFDFIYILTREVEGWVISRYTYRNLPPADLTPTPAPSPSPKVTPTVTPAPADLESE